MLNDSNGIYVIESRLLHFESDVSKRIDWRIRFEIHLLEAILNVEMIKLATFATEIEANPRQSIFTRLQVGYR